jgi:hypothetical protein
MHFSKIKIKKNNGSSWWIEENQLNDFEKAAKIRELLIDIEFKD